jgi:hypothetical protein
MKSGKIHRKQINKNYEATLSTYLILKVDIKKKKTKSIRLIYITQ